MDTTNEILNNLSSYMLDNKNITNILNNIPTINKLEKKEKKSINSHIHRKDLFYYPDNSCADSLFWCINIFRNGMDVIFNSNHKFTSEKTEKFAIVSLLREKKQLLKTIDKYISSL